MIGKTNTPEFGITCVTESELNGACRNPWDTSRTPGGSSGGAAAAVAAGVLPLAHGSDGGGSVRIPAACCGLFGLKPSRGRVSPAPYVSGSLELSQSGPLSVTVRDAAAFLDVIAGYEPGDAHWAPPPERPFLEEVGADPGRLRIAFTAEPAIPHAVDPRLVDVARAAPPTRSPRSATTSSSDTAVGRRVAPVGVREALAADACALPRARRLAADADQPRARCSARTRRRASTSRGGRRAACAHARRIVAFWDDVDVVLTPALAKLPVPVGWVFEPDDPWEQFARGGEFTPFTPIVNVTGQPAAVVPFEVVDGLPAGIQLIGPPAGEAVLFRLAAQLEAAHPWADRCRGLTHRG